MKKKKSGFTLVELLAVIVILATIISIATGTVISILNRTRKQAAVEVRNNLAQVAITYALEGKYLEKCSLDFSREMATNHELNAVSLNDVRNQPCYAKVTVEEVKAAGLFEDGRGFCDNSDTIIVYRYTEKDGENENSEYKAFISDTICNN